MASIHFILQGKGGVGKSMIAAMLYQALQHFQKEVVAFDTDPVNNTLTSFRDFNVTQVDVLKDGNIDQRKFDVLLEGLVNLPPDSHAIIDNGASSFIALASYLEENDVLSLLEESGHKVFFHTVVTGGQALVDTMEGMVKLCMVFPNTPLIVWLNPFFGDIAVEGKNFEEFTGYVQNMSHIQTVIKMPKGNASTIGRDLEELFALRRTFEAAINGSSTHIAVKSRLRKYWNSILTCVENAQIF